MAEMLSVYSDGKNKYAVGQTTGGKFGIFTAKIDKRRKCLEWQRLKDFPPLKGLNTMQKRLDNHADNVGWRWSDKYDEPIKEDDYDY